MRVPRFPRPGPGLAYSVVAVLAITTAAVGVAGAIEARTDPSTPWTTTAEPAAEADPAPGAVTTVELDD